MRSLCAPTPTLIRLLFVLALAGCSTADDPPSYGSTDAEPAGSLTTGLFDTVGITADYPVGDSSSGDDGLGDTSGDVDLPPSGCTTPQECVAAPECPMGAMLCDMQCINTDSNNDYCGICFDQCPIGEVCSRGMCEPTCGPGLILCPTGCADASSDPLNCGGCDIACDPMQICNMGLCEGGPTCGVDMIPPGGPCPPECTGGCSGATCTIDCASSGACDHVDIVCPPDFACEVICDGADACDDATIECPPDYGCQVSCSGGHDACGDIQLDCGDGTCTLDCEADACSGAQVDCGIEACTANCTGMPFPMLEGCGGSCACALC